MFGRGQQTADQGSQNVSAGINSGFKAGAWFVPASKEGESWKAWDFEFDGAISPRDRIFMPTLKTTPADWDADNLVKFNKRRETKKQSPMTMPEFLQHQYEGDLKNLDKQLRMYAFTFYPDGSQARKDADEKLPSYNSTEEFVENIDAYIDILKSLVPQGYENMSYDLILGKKSGDQYLSFPAIYTTGRYIKLSDDTSRELKLSKKFTDKFMEAAPAAAPAAQPAASIAWGKPATPTN